MTAVRQDGWRQHFRARAGRCGPPDVIGENPPAPRLGQSLTRRIEPLPAGAHTGKADLDGARWIGQDKRPDRSAGALRYSAQTHGPCQLCAGRGIVRI
jgi:hypothetical protein